MSLQEAPPRVWQCPRAALADYALAEPSGTRGEAAARATRQGSRCGHRAGALSSRRTGSDWKVRAPASIIFLRGVGRWDGGVERTGEGAAGGAIAPQPWGGGSWSPGGPSSASPTSRGESGSVAPAKAQPSLQRVRTGGGGEDRLLRRGPSPLASRFLQNGAGLARTRRSRRAVAPAPQAPGSSPPAAGPPRPGAEGLGGGRNPAQRRRLSAPTQAGFSRGARHPETEGRGSDAADGQGPPQGQLRPWDAPEGPAGAGLRTRHARLGPCAAPAARAAPPFSPACRRRRRRRGSALRIPSSRRLPAPRAAPASAHNGLLPPPPLAWPRPRRPAGILERASWGRRVAAPLPHLKFSSRPLPRWCLELRPARGPFAWPGPRTALPRPLFGFLRP